MGIMTRCKIIAFYLQKSVEIVGIHSVEAGYKEWHGRMYNQCIYYILLRCHYIRSLYPRMSTFNIIDTCSLLQTSDLNIEMRLTYRQLYWLCKSHFNSPFILCYQDYSFGDCL